LIIFLLFYLLDIEGSKKNQLKKMTIHRVILIFENIFYFKD